MKGELINLRTGTFLISEINLENIERQIAALESGLELIKSQKSLLGFLKFTHHRTTVLSKVYVYELIRFNANHENKKLTVSGLHRETLEKYRSAVGRFLMHRNEYALIVLRSEIEQLLNCYNDNPPPDHVTDPQPENLDELKQVVDDLNDELTGIADDLEIHPADADAFKRVQHIGQQLAALGLHGLDLLESRKLNGDLFSASEKESDHA